MKINFLEKSFAKCDAETSPGKLWFKGQLEANSFLVELIFILLSLACQGDSLITCELDYMLLSSFTSKTLQLNHKKNIVNSIALQIREEKGKVLSMFTKVNIS